MTKELYNNLVIKGSLVLFNMVAPHGEKPYFVVVESSVRIFVNYLVLQRSDLACLQILLYHAGPGRESRHGPEVQEAVCRGDRPGVPRSAGGGQVFSQELREEFGHYTGLHGVEATVQVYSLQCTQ